MSNSFVIPWTVTHQAPLSKGFPKQEYWSGLLSPPPGDFPDPGIELVSLLSTALAGGFFTTSASWEHLQKVKHWVTEWSSNSTPTHIPRRNENICSHKHCTQNFVTAPKRERTLMAISCWINKPIVVYHVTEYYSAIKRNGVPIHATRINLENIILSERNGSQEAIHTVRFHLYEMSEDANR